MRIQAVVFDRDHTLIHATPANLKDQERRLAEIVPGLRPEVWWEHWTTWPGPWPTTVEEEHGFWQIYWATIAERHQLSQEALGLLKEIGMAYHTSFAVYPDTQPCLSRLRERGLRLAVLTNFVLPSIDRPLHNAGVDTSWFEVLINSSMLGVEKPHPQAYLAVLNALQLPAEACVFVDDKPLNVQGALAVGMRGMVIDRNNQYPDYDGELVTRLDDLVGLLAT